MSNYISKDNVQKNFDIKEFLGKCKLKWRWFVVSFLCIALIGVYMLLKDVPTFKVNSNVMIYNESADNGTISLARQFSLGSVLGGSGNVNNELLVLQSHEVMLNTVKELNLNVGFTVKDGLKELERNENTTPLKLIFDKAIADTLTKKIRFYVDYDKSGKVDVKVVERDDAIAKVKEASFPVTVDTKFGIFTIVPTDKFQKEESLEEEIILCSYDASAESYSKKVIMEVTDRKSDMISLSFVTQDVTFGKMLLNTIVKNYNQKGIIESQKRDQTTLDFINNRLISLSDELSLSESEIEQFQKDKGLISLGAEAQIILSRLSNLEVNIETAETELSLLKQTRDFLRDSENQYSLIPAGIAGGSVGDIASSYNSLIMQRLQLSNSAKDGNKALQALNNRIDVTRSNVLLSIDKTIETSTFKLNEMKALNDEYEAKLEQFPSEQKSYRSIERQQSIKEQLYLFLLQQREETALSIANAQPRATIVDTAYPENEANVISVKKLFVVILFLTFAFPIGLLFLKERFRTRIESRDEAESLSVVPVLGDVVASDDKKLVIPSNDFTLISEQFRLMRANIKFSLPGKNEKVVIVTSTRSGEGKTFMAVNIAAAIATTTTTTTTKVLLIGADLRRPKLHEYTDRGCQFGLSDYLRKDTLSIDDIICENAIDGTKVDVIFSGAIPFNPSELLLLSKFDELIAYARENYDYIIIDSAPMLGISDTFNIARLADAMLYVCRVNVTLIEDLDFMNSLSHNHSFKKMMLVVNGVPIKGNIDSAYFSSNKK